MVVLGVGRGGAVAEAVLVSDIITGVLPRFPACGNEQGRTHRQVRVEREVGVEVGDDATLETSGNACEGSMGCFKAAEMTYARFV
jgi:hypothetical protein